MKAWNDLKNNEGYYYLRAEFNLNDLTILIAYVFLIFGGVLAYFLLKMRYQEDDLFLNILMPVLGILFHIPFVIYLITRIFSFVIMRARIKKYQREGKFYSAEMIDEIRGKKIFDAQPYDTEILNTDEIEIFKKRYQYRPVVRFYENGEEIQLTSRYDLNTSYKTALSSSKVHIYVLGNDFIIADTNESREYRPSLSSKTQRVNTLEELEKERIAKMIVAITAIVLIVIGLLRLGLKFLIKILIK